MDKSPQKFLGESGTWKRQADLRFESRDMEISDSQMEIDHKVGFAQKLTNTKWDLSAHNSTTTEEWLSNLIFFVKPAIRYHLWT